MRMYYYYLVCEEAIGTVATPGLLCQPRVIVKMIVEKQMDEDVLNTVDVSIRPLLFLYFTLSLNVRVTPNIDLRPRHSSGG
jgi:hypothetical protein